MLRIFDGWRGFLLGVTLLVACAAGIDYANSTRAFGIGAQALSSLVYGLTLLVYGFCAGGLLWLGIRLLKGESSLPDARETVLWSSCLIALLITAARVLE